MDANKTLKAKGRSVASMPAQQSLVLKSFQPELDSSKLLEWVGGAEFAKNAAEDIVDLDVCCVGAGPAALTCAYALTKAGSNATVGVFEKAATIGGHSLSGAVLNPRVLYEVFGEGVDFPKKTTITKEALYYLSARRKWPLPVLGPMRSSKGACSVSLSELVRWMGAKCESEGVDIFTGTAVQSLILDKSSKRVLGIRTVPAGLKRNSNEPPDSPSFVVRSKLTILAEGVRGSLTQALIKELGLQPRRAPLYALGVKELWRLKPGAQAPKGVVHTMGWPLNEGGHFGGSWLYPMGEGKVSLGLVAGLDAASVVDVHAELQRLKGHGLFANLLQGGECLEWGAKCIPEGGWESLPSKFSVPGAMVLGDALGLVNVPALKGIHYAMESGRIAALVAKKALQSNDVTCLDEYDKLLKSGFVGQDLKRVRDVRAAFGAGFLKGSLMAGMMILTGGRWPRLSGGRFLSDAEHAKVLPPQHEVAFKKADAVYLSGNKTRDDIPTHVVAGDVKKRELGLMYQAMCPAGVYEWDEETQKLKIHAPNCVDCKATDVLGPRWYVREGGAGPEYKEM